MPMLAVSVELETALFLGVFALGVLGAVFLVKFAFAMIRRATVKRHLLERGCVPIKVRWLVLAWFRPGIRPPGPSAWIGATAFRAIYSDPDRFIHKAYCWVGYDISLLVAPLGAFLTTPINIKWVKDEIIGELPLPEVWVSDEIITKKLKGDSQTDSAPRE